MRATDILAKRLRQWREDNGVLVKQVALEIGVTDSAVSQWESGRRFPSGDHLDRLSELTGLPICRLFCPSGDDCSIEAGNCALTTGR